MNTSVNYNVIHFRDSPVMFTRFVYVHRRVHNFKIIGIRAKLIDSTPYLLNYSRHI